MSDLNSILISMGCGLILVVLETILDHKIIKRYSINKLGGVILRSMIIAALLIPLFIWTKNQIPGTLSIIQKNITVSYSPREGLKLEGNFSGKKNKHIYLLTRQVLDTSKEVWTVTREVVSINLAQSTWEARIFFQAMSGNVSAGDIYCLIGFMTDVNMVDNAQIETSEIKKLNGVITGELEIKIKEISNV